MATNIAETSLTVPGVTAVVDSGLHKVARYDAARGIDSLGVERIPADAADQRAGRAGRLSAGIVWRLWDARDRLRPHREPEIHRVDLCSTVLDVVAWGGDPHTFDWFERPRLESVDAAFVLLERLGAIDAGRLTAIGKQVHQLPLHPRLARMLIAANGAREMAQACALLSEAHFIPARSASTTSDLLSAIDGWRNVPPHVQVVAREIGALAQRARVDLRASPGGQSFQSHPVPGVHGPPAPRSGGEDSHHVTTRFRRGILAGYGSGRGGGRGSPRGLRRAPAPRSARRAGAREQTAYSSSPSTCNLAP